MDNFLLESEFEKNKVLDLIAKARIFLLKTGNVQTALWSIEPFAFSLHLNQVPTNSDMSILMEELYKFEEVHRISLGVEPASKWILLHVALNERWFCTQDRKANNEKPRRKSHPENELEA